MKEEDILFEDNSILVVNKPAGLAVQTAKIGEKDLLGEARNYLKVKGEAPDVFPIHRLDQPVSGIVLLAKTPEAAATLSKDMQADAFSKDYKARVYIKGKIERSGELRDFLLKQKDNTSKVVSKETKGAKEAILTFEVTAAEEDNASLTVRLKTGRHHQIRVQLSNAGMPILGDLKYGNEESLAVSKRLNIKTVALTAYKLKFKHPDSGKPMEFSI